MAVLLQLQRGVAELAVSCVSKQCGAVIYFCILDFVCRLTQTMKALLPPKRRPATIYPTTQHNIPEDVHIRVNGTVLFSRS